MSLRIGGKVTSSSAVETKQIISRTWSVTCRGKALNAGTAGWQGRGTVRCDPKSLSGE